MIKFLALGFCLSPSNIFSSKCVDSITMFGRREALSRHEGKKLIWWQTKSITVVFRSPFVTLIQSREIEWISRFGCGALYYMYVNQRDKTLNQATVIRPTGANFTRKQRFTHSFIERDKNVCSFERRLRANCVRNSSRWNSGRNATAFSVKRDIGEFFVLL